MHPTTLSGPAPSVTTTQLDTEREAFQRLIAHLATHHGRPDAKTKCAVRRTARAVSPRSDRASPSGAAATVGVHPPLSGPGAKGPKRV